MSTPGQPRLLSFALDGWPVLGDRVAVTLTNGVAVLVGRNGAGKSAILEGFEAVAAHAIGRNSRLHPNDGYSFPQILHIEVLTPTDRRLEYRYELKPLPPSDDESDLEDPTSDRPEENLWSWHEHCQYRDGAQEPLWETDQGLTTFQPSEEAPRSLQVGSTLLRQSHFFKYPQLLLPKEAQWVYSVLRGVRLLGKALIFPNPIRRPSLLPLSGKGISPALLSFVDSLARKVFRMDPEDQEELEQVCQRIGLGSKITVQTFFSRGAFPANIEAEGEDAFFSVLLDGVNIGVLSDGTLWVLAILLEILPSYPHATTIIEEPETKIHPGLLGKLLHEINAYTFEENLILSTHSPQVVAWTSPDKINLVYRHQGRTSVRKLREDETQKVVAYLHEEGDLGDWLYSGILDE